MWACNESFCFFWGVLFREAHSWKLLPKPSHFSEYLLHHMILTDQWNYKSNTKTTNSDIWLILLGQTTTRHWPRPIYQVRLTSQRQQQPILRNTSLIKVLLITEAHCDNKVMRLLNLAITWFPEAVCRRRLCRDKMTLCLLQHKLTTAVAAIAQLKPFQWYRTYLPMFTAQ